MTNPQSPASPLPEAAEPVAREEVATLRVSQWPTGLEWSVDADEDMLQRLTAGNYRLSVIAVPRAAPSPVAQAPAQAGEVARLPSDEEIWSNDLVMAANASAGLPMLVLGLLVRNSLRAFATLPAQPVLAPVVREPLTDDEIRKVCLHSDSGTWNGAWLKFARAIEAAHSIQATTGEQSHG